eukprot:3972021-Prorocentrum_lima.AAC.1
MHRYNIILLQETHLHRTDERLFNDGSFTAYSSNIMDHPFAGEVLTLIKSSLFPGHWAQQDIVPGR